MLRTTHTSEVTEDQIDHLGHMNVRFYATNAHAGTRAVLAGLPGWHGRRYALHDVYTRHHREQLLGTPLVVRSAVLGASAEALRLHHELAAADSGVLAATFVHRLSPLDRDGRRVAVPVETVAAAAAEAIALPGHAATRTISLDADLLSAAPSLDLLRERRLELRKPRTVAADECGEDGRYRIELAPLLTWGGEPLDGEMGEVLHETADGRRMGWASMETRVQVGVLPRAGARVQSFGAGVGIHDKVTHRVHWTFDVDSGALLTAFEAVSMAFDITRRSPMSIPDGYRRRELERLQPDLAPQPVG